MQGERTFQIKSFKPKHTYGKIVHKKLVTSTYLCHKFLDDIKDDPKAKVNVIQKKIKRKLFAKVSHSKVYRAKRKAPMKSLMVIIGGNMQSCGIIVKQ